MPSLNLFQRKAPGFVPLKDVDASPNTIELQECLGLKAPLSFEKKTNVISDYLEVMNQIHHEAEQQKIDWKKGVPVSVLAAVISLLACHTYVKPGILAGKNDAKTIAQVLAGSISLNWFVNTYYSTKSALSMLGANELSTEEAVAAINRLRDTHPNVWAAGGRTVVNMLLTFGAMFPFFSVDSTSHDMVSSDFPATTRKALEAIPEWVEKIPSWVVGTSFALLLYNSVNDMREQMSEKVMETGAWALGIERGQKPIKIATSMLDKDRYDFKIVKNRLKDYKRSQNALLKKMKKLKQAHSDTMANSRAYYLHLIQTGKTTSKLGEQSATMSDIYELLSKKNASHDETVQLMWKLNNSHDTGATPKNRKIEDPAKWFFNLVGCIGAVTSLYGYVTKACVLTGSMPIGWLVSSPLLYLVGVMVISPMLMDFTKNIANLAQKLYNGKSPTETLGQYLKGLWDLPLYMMKNPAITFPLLAIPIAGFGYLAYYSTFISVLLNQQALGASFSPLLADITIAVTMLFNWQPVAPVLGGIAQMCEKMFGGKLSQDQIRLDEFCSDTIDKVNSMGSNKFYEMCFSIIENDQLDDAKKEQLLESMFGKTDLQAYLNLENYKVGGKPSHLQVVRELKRQWHELADNIEDDIQLDRHQEDLNKHIPTAYAAATA